MRRPQLLQALAYLFAHPGIDAHVEREWNAVDPPPDKQRYVFTVDREVLENVMIRYAGTAVRPVKPLPLVER